MRVIEIVPYQANWAAEFQQLGAALRLALGPLALRIDHIGSTSVPGLGAKDVLDVQVTVAALTEEPLAAAFSAAGRPLLPEVLEDHRPAGDRRPETDWQKRYCSKMPRERRSHIHVRAAGAANQRYALLFRDFLRSDPSASGSYERIKRELARLHPHDADAYYAVKDPACDLIMAAAERWAVSVNWCLGPPDASVCSAVHRSIS